MFGALLCLVPLFWFVSHLQLTGEAKVGVMVVGVLVVLALVMIVQMRANRARRIDELAKQGLTADDARQQLVNEGKKVRQRGRVIFLISSGLTLLFVLIGVGLYLAGVNVERCVDLGMIGVPVGLIAMLRGMSQMVSGVAEEEKQA
jgi:hypothetical protein